MSLKTDDAPIPNRGLFESPEAVSLRRAAIMLNLRRSGAIVTLGRGHQQKVTTDSIAAYRRQMREKRK